MATPPRSFLIRSTPPRARRSCAPIARPVPGIETSAVPPAAPLPPRHIAGTVVDAATGAPLAGARVAIADVARRLAPLRAREVATDMAGRFSSPCPRGGAALLLARRDGYLPEIASAEGEVVISLARAGAIAGKLTRGDGVALAGARVDAVSRDAMDVGHALTGPDGRFVLSTLRPGRYLVAPHGAGAAAPVWVDVRAGSAAHLALLARDEDPANG